MESTQNNPVLTRRSLLVAAAASSTVALLGRPAQAYDVVINPTAPQLGDTISVMAIPQDPGATTPPRVTVNDGTEYPTFPIGRHRMLRVIHYPLHPFTHSPYSNPPLRQGAGSTHTPWTYNPQCRCGPAAAPVLPTAPITWPTSTRSPSFTSMRLR